MTDLEDGLAVIDAALSDMAVAKPTLTGAAGKRCRRHDFSVIVHLPTTTEDGAFVRTPLIACSRCGAIRDETRARRGRNNRSRGNAIEREIAAKLGLRRVGQYGGADDIRGGIFAGQVKSGVAFPERLWTWLKAVPVDAGQTPILVVTDAPGPGNRRRALVVLTLEDWRSLHGPVAQRDSLEGVE